jgi:hypothetical protein
LGINYRRFKRVICFFIDALGWRFVQPRIATSPLLQAIHTHGTIAQLTSQFPSTTAAHMTAFHTGLPPAQSGIYEWQYYEPLLDALICPLPYSWAGKRRRESLLESNVPPHMLLPQQTLYTELLSHEIQSTCYIPAEYADSTYSKQLTKGASRKGFATLSEGLQQIVEQCQRDDVPSYINLYHPSIDTIGHRHGPLSEQMEAEIDLVLHTIEQDFFRPMFGHTDDTLFLMTADHGQVEVSPDNTTYLNQQSWFQPLIPMLQTNRAGIPLIPAGSCRDMFLYIKPDHLEEVESTCRTHLKGIADVISTKALMDAGYFGGDAFADSFLGRIAQLAILPYKHEAVWWYEKGIYGQNHRGHHGGLTPDELHIPLLSCDLSR